jgi:hypothetical protein
MPNSKLIVTNVQLSSSEEMELETMVKNVTTIIQTLLTVVLQIALSKMDINALEEDMPQ